MNNNQKTYYVEETLKSQLCSVQNEKDWMLFRESSKQYKLLYPEKIPYLLYMQTEAWKSLRQASFALHGRKCQSCGEEGGLECHHQHYLPNLFEVKPERIIPLCRACHQKEHERIKESIRKHKEKREAKRLAKEKEKELRRIKRIEKRNKKNKYRYINPNPPPYQPPKKQFYKVVEEKKYDPKAGSGLEIKTKPNFNCRTKELYRTQDEQRFKFKLDKAEEIIEENQLDIETLDIKDGSYYVISTKFNTSKYEEYDVLSRLLSMY